jgi:hypothetical protein
MSILVSFIACCLHAIYRPCRDRWLNIMQSAALILIMFTFQSGLLIKHQVLRVGSIDSSSAFADLMAAANIIYLGAPVAVSLFLMIGAVPERCRHGVASIFRVEHGACELQDMAATDTLQLPDEPMFFNMAVVKQQDLEVDEYAPPQLHSYKVNM